jgi:hypothetical protein
VLAGGRGDGDLVAGGAGDDVFRYGRGDGRDTLIDGFAGTWERIWSNGSFVNGFTRDSSNRVLRDDDIVFDGTNWLGRIQFDVSAQQLTRLVPAESGALGADATIASEAGDTIEFGLGINIQDIMLGQSGYDLVRHFIG